ncbi:MAG: hypothetical protein RLZZ511_3146, partial [Cyanobacteriota bacterium]
IQTQTVPMLRRFRLQSRTEFTLHWILDSQDNRYEVSM